MDTPSIVRTFYNQHQKELLNILKYIQTLGLVNEYHPLDIDLLAAGAVKHYSWKTEHHFKAEELDLTNSWSRELKSPFVNRLQEPPWIPKQWHELMAFLITGRHLYVGPLTAKDIGIEKGMPDRFKESSSEGKGREPVTPQREQCSKHQQRIGLTKVTMSYYQSEASNKEELCVREVCRRTRIEITRPSYCHQKDNEGQ